MPGHSAPGPAGWPGLADLPVNVWFVGQEGLVTQRRDRYSRESIHGHWGKMRPELARQLIATYSRPGEWVLDPMSGIGTTGVEAVHLGRHYVGIEWEPRFVRWQRGNLRRARTQGASGRFAVIQGDARRLDRPFSRAGPPLHPPKRDHPSRALVDLVLLSPPYADRLGERRNYGISPYVERLLGQRPRTPTLLPTAYGEGAENLGNLTGTAYLSAMRHVYAGCLQVLRPGGLLVIVIQPNRIGPRLDPLHHKTARLCQDLGFEFLDEIAAVVGRVVAGVGGPVHLANHASFWRRLATARLREDGWPVTLNQLDYVLVFRRPEGTVSGPTPKAAFRPPLPAQGATARTEVTFVR
jgi:SAM-dependent methyltransferase